MVIKCIQLNDLNLIRTDDEIDFWKRIFAKIPYPMAVITKLSDLLIYNELFAKIGILPKECLAFKDQERIEINQQFYLVKKIEINLNNQMVYYFIFYSTEKIKHNNKDHKGKIDELGIVSSSIAHELNNPLAGILAAISLISLEDFWSDESLLEIEDMKNGAKRCKELVEIFLGFSRFSPSDKFHTSLKASLDQAINLLRFRMVESNLRIEMKYTPSLESFMPKFNSSILSMIMYLIMSELLTAFAHHRLVTQHNLNSMIGEVIEFSNQIVFRLDDDFEYEEKLAQSKLLQHLLMFEKLEISFSKGMIRIQAHG
jgi:signal transduction histidine kinase